MNIVQEKINSGKKIRLITLMLTSTLLIASCGGGGLTSEQLQELEETKAAALTAEKKVQSFKQERKTLNEDLAMKRSDLKKLLEEKEILMEKFRKIQEMTDVETEADASKVDEENVE